MRNLFVVLLSCSAALLFAKEPVVRLKSEPQPAAPNFSSRDVRTPLDEVFTSTDVPVDIPDFGEGEAISNLVINAEYNIVDLNVFVSITHTYLRDLQIYLRKQDGPEVLLFNRRGNNGQNITDCTFDDEATTPIGSGSAPFTGTFRPEAPLTAFDEFSITGTWQLRVVDNEAADVGTIDEWGIDVTPADANNGEIQGAITSVGNGDPIARARIFVSGQDTPDCTPEDGTYRFVQVPPATYTVTVNHEFYFPSIHPNVVVQAGGIAFVDAALTPWPDLQTVTVPSTGAAVPINDQDTSYKSIVVGDDFLLSDIDVIIDITHSYMGDLNIWVENPAGDRALLHDSSGTNAGDNATNCRFDDEACASYSDAAAPYTGRWAPVAGSLTDAENGSAQGQWRLVVYDNFLQDEGSINSWTLIASHFTVLAAENPRPDLPESFRFDGNFPNPFNNTTAFSFQLGRAEHVSLKIFDNNGRQVATVIDNAMNPGEHKAYFDASGLSSGLYFARMTAGTNSQTQKMVLLK